MAKISRTKIANLIADRTLTGETSKKFDTEIAAYLIAEGRTHDIDSILRDVQSKWANNGLVEVVAVTAHPLTQGAEADVKKEVKTLFPNAKKIIVSQRIDETVIGGVRLELPNLLLDLSVRAKLNKFNQLTVSGKD